MKQEKIATRQSYGEALKELGKINDNVVVLDADLSGATKTNIFAKEFPNRFLEMGISEQDMMSTAAGLATCGKIPYASTFAVFAAGRAYDQIRNSICYPNLNVKICATHSGITVGEDGATHQMLEDISMMRTLPNMTVIATSDDTQTRWAVEEISKIKGPVYLRLSRMATPVIYEESIDAAPEKFAVISKLLGGTDEKDCVETIKKLLKDIDLETTLGEQGITEEDVDWMAENCMKVSEPSMAAHPKEFSIEDIKRIYKKAL